MQANPLPKEIYEKAVAVGVTKIVLRFSGGNDEGYLNVDLYPEWHSNLAQEIESWAWESYEYSGAGDGSDYGDDVTYDLVNKKVMSQEWYMRREEGNPNEVTFDKLNESKES